MNVKQLKTALENYPDDLEIEIEGPNGSKPLVEEDVYSSYDDEEHPVLVVKVDYFRGPYC